MRKKLGHGKVSTFAIFVLIVVTEGANLCYYLGQSSGDTYIFHRTTCNGGNYPLVRLSSNGPLVKTLFQFVLESIATFQHTTPGTNKFTNTFSTAVTGTTETVKSFTSTASSTTIKQEIFTEDTAKTTHQDESVPPTEIPTTESVTSTTEMVNAFTSTASSTTIKQETSTEDIPKTTHQDESAPPTEIPTTESSSATIKQETSTEDTAKTTHQDESVQRTETPTTKYKLSTVGTTRVSPLEDRSTTSLKEKITTRTIDSSFSTLKYAIPCTTWTAIGKSLFCFSDIRLNWFEAAENCRLPPNNGRLAVIDNDEDNKLLISARDDTRDDIGWCWINVHDMLKEGEWMFENGVSASYLNWRDGEPNGNTGDRGDQDCVFVDQAGEFRDYNCNDPLYFICQVRR